MLSAKPDLRWLFLGDSITQGAEHTYGERDYTQLFQERIRFELGRKEDLIVNAAFSGAKVSSCLTQLKQVLAVFSPEVAFIMIGTNDAAANQATGRDDFEQGLKDMVRCLREAGAHVILQTPNPIVEECAAPYRDHFGSICSGIRAVASAENVMLLDHCAHWDARFSGNRDSLAAYYMCDGIHPNAFGHRLLAFHLFAALGLQDPASKVCRLFLP